MKSNNKVPILGLTLLVLISVGCAPVPIKRTFSPSFKGTIKKGDKAASNYKISFSTKDVNACSVSNSDYLIESTTDNEGKFSLPEKKKWSLFRMIVPAHGISQYNICITSPENQKKWAYGSFISTHEWMPEIEIFCDFQKLNLSPQQHFEKVKFSSDIPNGCTSIE